MKTLYTTFIFLLSFQCVIAQIDTINFEMNVNRIEIDTSNANNIWEIGTPNKTIFDSSYSAPYAIITDSINFYDTSNTSSFQVGFNLTGNIPSISFRHKFDTDIGLDGGYVEVSFHGGDSNWILLTDTTMSSNQNMAPYDLQVLNFYAATDTLHNGIPGFNGLQSNWMTSTIVFPCIAVKGSFPFYVRFTFVSDSIQTNKEGWMIDDITIKNEGYCASINEITSDNMTTVYPNPFSTITTIKIENSYKVKNAKLLITDLMGRQQVNIPNINTNVYTFDRMNLADGIYLYTLVDKNGIIGNGKFIIK